MGNNIKKHPVASLGYNFVDKAYLKKGEDEYYLRNAQNRNGIVYRKLTAYEIEVLVRNRNTSDDWGMLQVSDAFNPELVKNCKFFGLIRIGKLEPYYLEFSDFKAPVGLYNSNIISCDFGDNVLIDNVNYLSHYIIGNEVIIVNVNELVTTNHSKFGNGIVKDGEEETTRVKLEVCNENGGRSITPFNGMLPGDAYMWSKYRGDKKLLEKFTGFTELLFTKKRGYYGKIGDRTVIKNTAILKDVWIGSDAYIKGANKIKNITINSSSEAKSQIGEGCELVNGIIGFGCRIFYGVKAVRFVMASHSQLKYGARLINSYLGNNATISCCEVLNSLIFPSHEQHHNNSFLCAALVMGQSNIAAGATIGSNHNSRSADGEIIAGRGFWPGLCVSLKHNSKFASYTMLAKGDYPNELQISIPFSLVSNDIAKDQLTIMPGYWFMYNMYALERNSWKYIDRDRRTDKTQHIEYDYLAPDTINEIISSLKIFELAAGKAYLQKENATKKLTIEDCNKAGALLLKNKSEELASLEITASGFENSKRKTVFAKLPQSYQLFEELVVYYSVTQLLKWISKNKFKTFEEILAALPAKTSRTEWLNIGGQLIPTTEVDSLRERIRTGKTKSWDDVHKFYVAQGEKYDEQKLKHALASLTEVTGIHLKKINTTTFALLLTKVLATKEWMVKGIYDSRAKDYTNPYRKMVYDTNDEMNEVIGKLDYNSFIIEQTEALKIFRAQITALKKKFKLK